jgi:uncharacterized membrane protein
MTLIPLHVVAGVVGLVSGYLALYAFKGAKLHRKSGTIFVYAMLLMSATGAVIAASRSKELSVIAGSLTFYLVMTSLLTVRRPAVGALWLDVGAMLMALVVGIAGVSLGLEGLHSVTGKIDGEPAAVAIVFGSIALIAALLDIRMLLARGIKGAHRLARHLWRMCFALLLATASFFLGQAQVFPEPIRNFALLSVPVILVFLLMLYWLARVLFTQRYRRA